MRLAAGLWVQAYLRRLQLTDIPAYILKKGDATAGSVIVKIATLDGRAVAKSRSFDPVTGGRIWMVLAEGSESEVDESLEKQRRFDPDLWIVELESRSGRDLLDEEGLAD